MIPRGFAAQPPTIHPVPRRTGPSWGLAVLAALLLLPGSGHAQPSHAGRLAYQSTFSPGDTWWTGFAGTAVTGDVFALHVHDGNLVAGGSFASAGITPGTRGLGLWNGNAWQSLNASGVTETRALATYQGDLIAGGLISTAGGAPSNAIMRFDGAAWNAMGTGISGVVRALGVVGTDLIAGGEFIQAGGVSAANVARWDGAAWSALGPGLPDRVNAVVEYNGEIVVGGRFQQGGNPKLKGIARWTGSAWDKLGAGMDGEVLALAVYQGQLIAGGTFNHAGGNSGPGFIARWDGSSWTALGSGTSGWVGALLVQDGSLYAAGGFSQAGGASAMKIARWDGVNWTPLGSGMAGTSVSALASDGITVFAGGDFASAGGLEAVNLAAWDGAAWNGAVSSSGGGLGGGPASVLRPTAQGLVVGGDFAWAGGAPIARIARWNGAAWEALGSGMNGEVRAVTEYNGELVAAGSFTTAGGVPALRIARWDGSQWQPLGSGLGGIVHALAVYNGDLYAGGQFETAGGVAVNGIARWDGSAWYDVGGGLVAPQFEFAWVRALAVYNGVLVVGGRFVGVGGHGYQTVASWNGSQWGPMGSGTWATTYVAEVRALTLWNGDLVAGGDFTHAGGASGARYVARFNGGWQGVGTPDTVVSALTACEGNLLAGSERGVTYWDSAAWSYLGGESNAPVYALCEYGNAVYGGGAFSTLGGTGSQGIGRWGGQQVGIGDGPAPPVVLGAFPNPFRAGTTVAFTMERAGRVDFGVYDVQGRRRFDLAEGYRPAGRYEMTWDGRDAAGRQVPAGIYYLKVSTPTGAATHKILRLR